MYRLSEEEIVSTIATKTEELVRKGTLTTDESQVVRELSMKKAAEKPPMNFYQLECIIDDVVKEVRQTRRLLGKAYVRKSGFREEQVKDNAHQCIGSEKYPSEDVYTRLREVLIEEGEMKRVPEVEYPIPILPVEELPEPERQLWIGWLAGMLDAEGTVDDHLHGHDTVGRVDRLVYRYEYLTPRVLITTTTYDIAVQWCTLIGIRIPTLKPPRYPYHPTITGARAIAYLILTKPYLIKYREKANQWVAKYRETPNIRVRSKEG